MLRGIAMALGEASLRRPARAAGTHLCGRQMYEVVPYRETFEGHRPVGRECAVRIAVICDSLSLHLRTRKDRRVVR
jgi:hypothetical protein